LPSLMCFFVYRHLLARAPCMHCLVCQIYCFGDFTTIPNPDIELTVRVHDECNGSDVFGSDICTCRPYLAHGIEECVKTAQRGGYVNLCFWMLACDAYRRSPSVEECVHVGATVFGSHAVIATVTLW
jgi:hypothetical protein